MHEHEDRHPGENHRDRDVHQSHRGLVLERPGRGELPRPGGREEPLPALSRLDLADRVLGCDYVRHQQVALPRERISPVTFMDERGLRAAFVDAAAWWRPEVNLALPGTEPVRVNTIETSANLFQLLGKKDVREPTNWSRRFKNHQEKLKSGDVYQCAEVVRNLAARLREKSLSAAEQSMYAKARYILISELAVSWNVDDEKAAARVDAALGLPDDAPKPKTA